MTKTEARGITPGLYTLYMHTVEGNVPVVGVIGHFDNGDAYYCTYDNRWSGTFANTLRWTEPHWQCVDHVESMMPPGATIGIVDNYHDDTPLQVGDVVTLKSGSPKMTVIDITEEGHIKVKWFYDFGATDSATYPVNALRRV